MTTDLSLDRQLCFALYSASRTVSSAYRSILSGLGLTYPQYLVMLVLWESDEQTVSQLGRRLHLDSGTLSPLLRRMETQGHLTKHRDPKDERSVVVTLTPQGRALRSEVEVCHGRLAAQVNLSPDEAETLRNLAQRLVATAHTNQKDIS